MRHQDPPRYEGRPLPRPDEEVVDQGLAFDLTEIPEETAGPYPGDGSNGPDVLSSSGIVRGDITTSFDGMSGTAEGTPMTLTSALTDMANGDAPFEDAAVYVCHCTREGGYSLYSDGVTDQNFLRGVQVAGADGTVTFTSVFPACYDGRWPHIHVEVYPDVDSITDAGNAIATSQFALPADICQAVYATEGVFGDDSGRTQLPTVTGDVASGYVLTLAVGVDTTTAAGGGSVSGGAPSSR